MLSPGCGWKNTIVNFITLKVNTYISKISPLNFFKATKNETIYQLKKLFAKEFLCPLLEMLKM